MGGLAFGQAAFLRGPLEWDKEVAMRMPYIPVAHRHIDRYAEIADDLGEMFGIAGAVIWHNFKGWVFGVHHKHNPVEEVEALYPFETPDPTREGLTITDEDIQGLHEMFISGPSVSAADVQSAENSKAEELQADHDEMQDMRRWIGKKLGFSDPYWKPTKR